MRHLDSLSEVWTWGHVSGRRGMRVKAMPTDDARSARFDSLYRAHAEAIRGYCLRRLGPDDAADAAADVFVVVWRRMADCPRGDEARLWMYGIARNIVANRRRATGRSASLLQSLQGISPTDAASPEGVVVRRSEYRELRVALARLPARYREVLILAEWDGLERETIARLEGVSRAAVDQRISRAYRKLARLMHSSIASEPRERESWVPPHLEGEG